jgi:uncharacterized phiE125 gp8 family phage protein
MIITATDRPVSFTRLDSSPAERLEPIDVTWGKQQLRVTATSEDNLVADAIAAARSYFEEQTGRQCLDAEWEYALDGVPDQDTIELPRAPLARVVAVTYDDGDGVPQVFDAANYRVVSSALTDTAASPSDPLIFDDHCAPGRLELVAGASWPSTSGRAASLRIRRVCGYGPTIADIPASIRQILALLLDFYYSRGLNRDSLLAANNLLLSFKWRGLSLRPPTTWTPTVVEPALPSTN